MYPKVATGTDTDKIFPVQKRYFRTDKLFARPKKQNSCPFPRSGVPDVEGKNLTNPTDPSEKLENGKYFVISTSSLFCFE